MDYVEVHELEWNPAAHAQLIAEMKQWLVDASSQREYETRLRLIDERTNPVLRIPTGHVEHVPVNVPEDDWLIRRLRNRLGGLHQDLLSRASLSSDRRYRGHKDTSILGQTFIGRLIGGERGLLIRQQLLEPDTWPPSYHFIDYAVYQRRSSLKWNDSYTLERIIYYIRLYTGQSDWPTATVTKQKKTITGRDRNDR